MVASWAHEKAASSALRMAVVTESHLDHGKAKQMAVLMAVHLVGKKAVGMAPVRAEQ